MESRSVRLGVGLLLALLVTPGAALAHAGGRVERVVSEGAADKAGIRVGDRILRLDGRPLETVEDLQQALAARRPGDQVEVSIERDGQVLQLALTYGARPDGGPSFGVALALPPAPGATGHGSGEPPTGPSLARDACHRWLDETYRIGPLSKELGIEPIRDPADLAACVAKDTARMAEPIPVGWCDNVMKVHCSGSELLTEIGETLADRCLASLSDLAEELERHPERTRCTRDRVFLSYYERGEALDAGACRDAYRACGEDGAWLQWGGPDQSFRAPASRLAGAWPAAGPKVLWRREIGEGFSAILYQRDRLFTMARRGDQEAVVCLDADSGETAWETRYDPPRYEGQHGFGIGPRSTPLLAGERLFTIGISGTLLALSSRSGDVLWRRELWDELGGNRLSHGYSSSPIAWEKTLIVPVGGPGAGLVALDQETGEIRWRSAPLANSYSSPRLIELGGEPQVLAFMAEELVGLDPRDGRLLWRFPHVNQWKHNISLPALVGRDTLVLSSPEAGAKGLRLHREGDAYRVEEIWANRRVQLYHVTSVVDGHWIYGSSGLASPAFLMAVDATTGSIAWRERGFGKANCVAADGRLLILDEDGKLALASASPRGLIVHAETQLLRERSWTAPTVVGQTLYARSEHEMLAVDLGA